MRIRGSWLMLSSVRMMPTARTMRSRRRRAEGEGPDGGGFDADDGDADGDIEDEGVDEVVGEGVNVDEDVEVDGISGSFGDSGLLFSMLFCLPHHAACNRSPVIGRLRVLILSRLPDTIIVSEETVQTYR